MKKISIFLASSIKDLAGDRVLIGNFINEMNNIYQSQNLFINLIKCDGESRDQTVVINGTQNSLDKVITESDFCIILFWHEVGKYTEHEMEAAYESFRKSNRPKIVVYFKNLEDEKEIKEDIKRIKQKIHNDWKYYHREYSNIDTLKLGIMTQLQVLGFVQAPFSFYVEGENVKLREQIIASTKKLPLFSQNKEYLKLVDELKKAENEHDELNEQYQKTKENALFRKLTNQASDCDYLEKKLKVMNSEILNIGPCIAKLVSSAAITERIQKAIECFDAGDYDGVLNLLTPEEIEQRASELDNREEQLLMDRKNFVEEYRLRILALEAKGEWDEVEKTYYKALEQVQNRSNMPKSIMLEFARFLYRQMKYEQGISICESLREIGPNIDLESFKMADLYELLGKLYYAVNNFHEAESMLTEALKLCETDTESKDDIRKAEICVELAKVYFMINQHFESERLYKNALEILNKHDSNLIDSVDASIAKVSLELGNLYYMINRHSDAAEIFLNAYDKYHDLVKSGKKDYSAELAEACYKVAYLYISVANHKITDRYYIEALRVKDFLTLGDASGYFAFLHRICEKLYLLWHEKGDAENASKIKEESIKIQNELQQGVYNGLEKEEYQKIDEIFYTKEIDKKKIEQLCVESHSIYTELAQNNPEAFEASLAQAQNMLAMFYSLVGNKKTAETWYAESIGLQERLSKINPKIIEAQLANSYSNLSKLYLKYAQYENAKKFSLKAIELYFSVSEGDAGAYDTDLARNWHELANLYTKTGESKEAEEYYLKSILLYFKLFKKSPRAYVDRIINTVADIAWLFDPFDSAEWMKEFTEACEVEKMIANYQLPLI